jgi:hypothetical protein
MQTSSNASRLSPWLPLNLPIQADITWSSRVILLLGITALLFFRAPHEFVSPQLWGEDGPIFLAQARTHGIASIAIPHAGYLHVLPRMLALTATLFPLEYVPRLYFLFAVSAVLLVCCFLSFIPWLPPQLKIAFPLTVVLTPHYGEVFFTLTNIHWIVALLFPFLALGVPIRSTSHLTRLSILIVVLALSDPFILFFYPLFFIRRLAHRGSERGEGVFFLVATFCACLQAGVLLAAPRGAAKTFDTDLWHWLEALLLRPVAGLFLGKEVALLGYTSTPVFILIGLALGLFLCTVLYSIITTTPQNRRILLFFFSVSAIAFTAAFLRSYDRPLVFAPFYGADRYYYIPYAFMIFGVLWFTHTVSGWRKRLGFAACFLILMSSVSVFQLPRRLDSHWTDHIKQLREQGHVRIPINPPGWSVDLYETPTSPDD